MSTSTSSVYSVQICSPSSLSSKHNLNTETTQESPPAMFAFPTPSTFSEAKCYATYGTMGHLDPNQMPAKKKGKPWSSLQAHEFVHKVDLIFPEEIQETMMEALDSLEAPSYRRVFMSLEHVLEKGPDGFFDRYIKDGLWIHKLQGVLYLFI